MTQTVTLQRGDLLVTIPGGKTYRIRDLGLHEFHPGSTSSMQHMTTTTVEVRRNPSPVGGKRSGPVQVYPEIRCTPIDDISGGVQIDGAMPAYELKRTYVDAGTAFYKVILEQREGDS